MIRTFFYLLVVLTAMVSCNDDDSSNDPSIAEVTDLEIVTGILLTDQNGQGIGSVGNPNTYNGLILYPNPPAGVQTAVLQSGEISEIYIIPAEKNSDFSRTEVMSAFNDFEGYEVADIQAGSTQNFSVSPANRQVQYRTDELAPGYYRVIAASAAGEQFGSAIFVDSTLAYPTEIIDSLNADWP